MANDIAEEEKPARYPAIGGDRVEAASMETYGRLGVEFKTLLRELQGTARERSKIRSSASTASVRKRMTSLSLKAARALARNIDDATAVGTDAISDDPAFSRLCGVNRNEDRVKGMDDPDSSDSDQDGAEVGEKKTLAIQAFKKRGIRQAGEADAGAPMARDTPGRMERWSSVTDEKGAARSTTPAAGAAGRVGGRSSVESTGGELSADSCASCVKLLTPEEWDRMATDFAISPATLCEVRKKLHEARMQDQPYALQQYVEPGMLGFPQAGSNMTNTGEGDTQAPVGTIHTAQSAQDEAETAGIQSQGTSHQGRTLLPEPEYDPMVSERWRGDRGITGPQPRSGRLTYAWTDEAQTGLDTHEGREKDADLDSDEPAQQMSNSDEEETHHDESGSCRATTAAA